MRTVALISGGKDSCFNMMQCVAAGHTIVALANLKPSDKDELDSYMYQSVGHQGIELYATAMGLPLYRQVTHGIAQDKTKDYTPTLNDEVEDLYTLLSRVKDEIDIEAVSVGAILSDYQRIRVENVCIRLGLVSLSYLWRRDQAELLQEMIDSGVEAIIIKVAALGLDPRKHLGLSLREAQSHLMVMKDKYGLNVCGEGGEYETLTLDCPLFTQKLVVEDKKLVLHSDDPVAPVGYLNLALRLQLKPEAVAAGAGDGCAGATRSVRNAYDFISEINDSAYSDVSEEDGSEKTLQAIDEDPPPEQILSIEYCDGIKRCISRSASIDVPIETRRKRLRTESGEIISSSPPTDYVFDAGRDAITDHSCIYGNTHGWFFIGGIVGEGADSVEYTEDALNKLCKLLSTEGLRLSNICSVNLYIRDMAQYAVINRIYSNYFCFPNPPTRVCVQCPLPPNVGIIFDAIAHKSVRSEEGFEVSDRCTMHVQSISHWAPANIGPYSQAVTVGQTAFVCGQIALIPGAMKLVTGARRQSGLALRHVSRVLRATQRHHIRSVVQGVCYVKHRSSIVEARRQLERRTAGAIVEYVVVGELPRAADVEWHTWAHTDNNHFHYEETGCNVGDYKVAICRRWNYENTVAAFVCYVATASSPSSCQLSFANEEAYAHHRSLANQMTADDFSDVLEYSVGRMLSEAEVKVTDPAVTIRIFYQVGCSPTTSALLSGAARACRRVGARAALTVVPVCALQNSATFVSISGAMLDE